MLTRGRGWRSRFLSESIQPPDTGHRGAVRDKSGLIERREAVVHEGFVGLETLVMPDAVRIGLAVPGSAGDVGLHKLNGAGVNRPEECAAFLLHRRRLLLCVLLQSEGSFGLPVRVVVAHAHPPDRGGNQQGGENHHPPE